MKFDELMKKTICTKKLNFKTKAGFELELEILTSMPTSVAFVVADKFSNKGKNEMVSQAETLDLFANHVFEMIIGWNLETEYKKEQLLELVEHDTNLATQLIDKCEKLLFSKPKEEKEAEKNY